MKKIKYVSALSALVIGFLIFSLSLILTSHSMIDGKNRASEKRFYIKGPILPDNIIYPVLMIADRMILSSSFGEHKVYTKIRLAEDRFRSAQYLLEKDRELLAFSALTKSQKYLLSAAHDVLSSENPSDTVIKDMTTALKINSQELLDCKDDFKHQDTTLIDVLVNESDVLIHQLEVL